MKPVRGRKKIWPFFSKKKVAESSVFQNLAVILSIAELSFAESSCNQTYLKPFIFQPSSSLESCEIFQKSLSRFVNRIFVGETIQQRKSQMSPNVNKVQSNPNYRGFLIELNVDMLFNNGCERVPHPEMDEKCIV